MGGYKVVKSYGVGNNGIVYELDDDNVVMKITSDLKEIAGALKAKRHIGLKHIVTPYNIHRIQNEKLEGNWVVMLLPRINPLQGDMKKWYSLRYGSFLNVDRSDKDFLDHTLNAGASEEEMEFWNILVAERQSFLKQIHQAKLASNEAHYGNVGFDKHGTFVYFDTWIDLYRMRSYGEDAWRSPMSNFANRFGNPSQKMRGLGKNINVQ